MRTAVFIQWHLISQSFVASLAAGQAYSARTLLTSLESTVLTTNRGERVAVKGYGDVTVLQLQ